MGTGTPDTNPKTETQKRGYVAARLFRGIVDILRTRYDGLASAIIAHVRTFDKPADESDWIYAETSGFWRMLLELTFQIYAAICFFVGILLVTVLVVASWPVRFLLEIFSGSVSATRHAYLPDPALKEPALTSAPTDSDSSESDKSKVVRRVVYEEAKLK